MHREISELIVRSFFEVYNALGYGHLESVSKRALVVALRNKQLHSDLERPFTVYDLGVNVRDYRADLVVENKIIVAVKTVPKIDTAHVAQCYNYLKAGKLHVALLLHFGPAPRFERHFLSNPQVRMPVASVCSAKAASFRLTQFVVAITPLNAVCRCSCSDSPQRSPRPARQTILHAHFLHKKNGGRSPNDRRSIASGKKPYAIFGRCFNISVCV